MKKRTFAFLFAISLLTVGAASAFAAFNKQNSLSVATAGNGTYTYTFNKSTWNGDYSENSVTTQFGSKLVIKTYSAASGAVRVGNDIDGLCSLRGDDCALYFGFSIQQISSITAVYEYENAGDSTLLKIYYGDSERSYASNGGTLTSGNARTGLSYFGTNKYLTFE